MEVAVTGQEFESLLDEGFGIEREEVGFSEVWVLVQERRERRQRRPRRASPVVPGDGF